MADGRADPSGGWVVVIPQKDLRIAKSRLGLAQERRRRLARAMLEDTLATALQVDDVRHVLLACDVPADVASLVFDRVTVVSTPPGAGLNGAVRAAEELAHRRWPTLNVAVVPGDLPYLEPEALRLALSVASRHERCFVPDAAGTGTTLLAATVGNRLEPSYGPGSCRDHAASGAATIGGDGRLWSLREDVDRLGELNLWATGLLGARTAAEVTRASSEQESDPSVSLRRTVDLPISVPGFQEPLPARLSTFHGLADGAEHVAVALGPYDEPVTGVPLVRVHSECLTGDLFGSLRCDCGPQLREAVVAIARVGGFLLYLRQEGRGIGLYSKVDAYGLQEEGLDTFQANRALGFADDERDFRVAAQMLSALGVGEVDLLTNNLQKVEDLVASGVRVRSRKPSDMHWTPQNAGYLETKIRAGHRLVPSPIAQHDVEDT